MTPLTMAATVLTAYGRLALSPAVAVVRTLAPHGGQETSRRNAWESMSADVQRARARREVDAALRDLVIPPRAADDEPSAVVAR